MIFAILFFTPVLITLFTLVYVLIGSALGRMPVARGASLLARAAVVLCAGIGTVGIIAMIADGSGPWIIVFQIPTALAALALWCAMHPSTLGLFIQSLIVLLFMLAGFLFIMTAGFIFLLSAFLLAFSTWFTATAADDMRELAVETSG